MTIIIELEGRSREPKKWTHLFAYSEFRNRDEHYRRLKMNKRKRRLIRRLRARENWNSVNIKSRPAKASDFLYWLKEYHCEHSDMRAIIYLRVSACSQNHNKNLENHEKVLRRKLERLSIPVLGCFHDVGSGWITNHKRGVLRKAICKARKFRNTVVITTSSDRFLRNRNFETNEPDLLPTVAEFETLKKLACDVPLVTLLHPDMSPKKVRSYQSKWGQKTKGNKGGRPIEKRPGYKKKLREKKLSIVRRLLKKGKNTTEIARNICVARSTVSDWIENYL